MTIVTKHIPNALTSLNLFLGATGVYFAISGHPDLTFFCIICAAIIDFFDGFVARLLNACSPIGKDLDSLADLVSFGLAPAAAFSSLLHFFATGKWSGEFWELDFVNKLILILPFVLTIFSAFRLAKFNNDSRQNEIFLGLTTTATGMFSVSFVYLAYSNENFPVIFTNPIFVLFLIILLSVLLVSEIPMFSLKFQNFKWKGNENRYLLLIISVISLIFLRLGAFVFIIPFYVFFSVVINLIKKK